MSSLSHRHPGQQGGAPAHTLPPSEPAPHYLPITEYDRLIEKLMVQVRYLKAQRRSAKISAAMRAKWKDPVKRQRAVDWLQAGRRRMLADPERGPAYLAKVRQNLLKSRT